MRLLWRILRSRECLEVTTHEIRPRDRYPAIRAACLRRPRSDLGFEKTRSRTSAINKPHRISDCKFYFVKISACEWQLRNRVWYLEDLSTGGSHKNAAHPRRKSDQGVPGGRARSGNLGRFARAGRAPASDGKGARRRQFFART